MCIGAAHVQSVSVEIHWLYDAYVVAALHLLVRAPNVGSKIVKQLLKQKQESCVWCIVYLCVWGEWNRWNLPRQCIRWWPKRSFYHTIILICNAEMRNVSTRYIYNVPPASPWRHSWVYQTRWAPVSVHRAATGEREREKKIYFYKILKFDALFLAKTLLKAW